MCSRHFVAPSYSLQCQSMQMFEMLDDLVHESEKHPSKWYSCIYKKKQDFFLGNDRSELHWTCSIKQFLPILVFFDKSMTWWLQVRHSSPLLLLFSNPTKQHGELLFLQCCCHKGFSIWSWLVSTRVQFSTCANNIKHHLLHQSEAWRCNYLSGRLIAALECNNQRVHPITLSTSAGRMCQINPRDSGKDCICRVSPHISLPPD